MAEEPSLKFTRSQIDKLGERLRKAETPSEEDERLLAEYEISLRDIRDDAKQAFEAIVHSALPDLTYEITEREKQIWSVIAKLRRERTRLSTMQDIMGFRLVVPTIYEQNRLMTVVPNAAPWKIIDRREREDDGYRAVHIIYTVPKGSVEIQVRTALQHGWAELSEQIDRVVPGVKHGEGPPEARMVFSNFSGLIRLHEHMEARVEKRLAHDSRYMREGREGLLRDLATIRQAIVELEHR